MTLMSQGQPALTLKNKIYIYFKSSPSGRSMMTLLNT